jgi:molybdopterin molybdotransferase
MLDLETAVERVLSAVPPAESEQVPLIEAERRVLAESLRSPIDLPPFDNSSMDGFALRAADVAAALLETPARLRLIGRVEAGQTFDGEVQRGDCVRLFTGSPLPAGADAVVMQEDTRLEPGVPGEVLVLEGVKPWENIRFRGGDVKRGALVAEAGQRVNAGLLSLLGALGLPEVSAGRQPVVGLLATGSELREPGQSLAPGQIYESNRLGLAALVRQAGAVPKVLPLVPDALTATRAALEAAFAQCDALVTSGGVSVGEMDFVKEAFNQMGGSLQFWKVAIKPGRPFVFGRWREKLLFGLPGNPVSATVTFLLLVRPALLRWQGATDVSLPKHPATLAEPLSNPGDRRHFLRVQMTADGKVRSAGTQASHVLSSMAGANALLELPPQATLAAGTTVQVMRL